MRPTTSLLIPLLLTSCAPMAFEAEPSIRAGEPASTEELDAPVSAQDPLPTTARAPMPLSPAELSDRRPLLDQRQPAHLETATFALG